MKSFYIFIFITGACILLISLFIPPSHGLPIDRLLSRFPTDWELKFNTADHLLMGRSEENSKSRLFSLLHDLRNSQEAIVPPWVSSAFGVAAIFGLLGYRREVYFEKKAKLIEQKKLSTQR